MLTIGADIGKFRTKIKWKGGVRGHLSKLATYREVKDNLILDENNIIIEYRNQAYIVGDLAEREGQNYLNSPELHKSNLVTIVNLLVELSRLPDTDFNVVVGNPFGINTEKERKSLKELLLGTKEFRVNGKPHRININSVGVGAEGLAAYYSDPSLPDDLNIWDFGSSTIHGICIRRRRLVDKRSHTFDFGFESLLDHDYKSLMLSLKTQMEKKWNDSNRKILCIGGKAPEMFNYVREHYPESNPTTHNNYEYANAIGLYNLGVVAYERAAN